MAARGVPVIIPALASSGTLAATYKIYGWVPDSAGAPTATPRTFYTDPELVTPASNPATLGASTRIVYVSPSTSIVLQIKSSDGATTFGEPYFPANTSDVGGLDDYAGATDTERMLAWVASGDRYLQLTRSITLTAEIAISNYCSLDLAGWTIFKGYNGNMFTMAAYSRIMNGRIDGAGGTYTGNGITISGGSGVNNQIITNVDIVNTQGYNLECSGDGSGSLLRWIGGSVNRTDATLDAIKLPDTESSSNGLRSFAYLNANGSAFMDVAGGRSTYISSCTAFSMTLGDSSAYVFIDDESRIVQFLDRRAVTGATKANPCVITSSNHGLANGNSVTFYNVGGMTQLNGNNYTVANVTANTFELSGINSTSYGTYTSGGTLKNRSTHVIRGTNHFISALYGVSPDGTAAITLAKNAASNEIYVHANQTLIDNSTVTSNRFKGWPDRIQHRTSAPYTVWAPGSDTVDLFNILGASGNSRFTMSLSSGNVMHRADNSVDLRFGVGIADDLIISTTAITNGLPLVLNGDTTPAADNSQKMGTASKRFSELFAGNGTINTSDATTKTPLKPVPDSVKRAMRRIMSGIGVFQFLDSVARKGPDKARLQIGVTAQSVRDAFAAEGEDAGRYALFCADPIFEDYEVTETVNELVPLPPVIRTVTDVVVTHELGRAIEQKVTREEQVYETETVLLFDEQGQPVIDSATNTQRRISRVKVELQAVTKTRIEKRRKLNEDGSGTVLLGLRPDQLFWLALACLTDTFSHPEPIADPDAAQVQPLGYPDKEPAPEASSDAPYVPDFTLIPEQLIKYSEADETASEFRRRLKNLWQRFGISDGQNFPGGGETLTGEEKIAMREIDMIIHSEEGRAAHLREWLFAD